MWAGLDHHLAAEGVARHCLGLRFWCSLRCWLVQLVGGHGSVHAGARNAAAPPPRNNIVVNDPIGRRITDVHYSAVTTLSPRPAKRFGATHQATINLPARQRQVGEMGLDDATTAQVVRQVEFYLGDSNLPRDKFLLSIIQDSGNPEQWVDLKTVAAFSRMRSLLKISAASPSDVSDDTLADLAGALKASSTALTVSEDGTKVKRNTLLADAKEAIQAADARSLYVGPFPYTATLEQITEFFEQHGPVNCVRLRRHMESKDFRGSAFVEFDSEETAAKVGALELVYDGAPLRMTPKTEFVEQKIAEREARTNSAHHKGEEDVAEEKEGDGGFEAGLVVFFKWKEGEDTAAVSREMITEGLGGADAGIAFIDYGRGAPEGHLRFKTPELAQKALEGVGEDKEKLLAGKTALMHAVEGEDEEKYWKQVAQKRLDLRSRGGGRGGRRGGGRGRGGRDNKRRRV
eukprot:jgi/Tetstr1/444582/TSEL_032433.t1